MMVVPGPKCAAIAAEMVQYGWASVPGPTSEQEALELSTKKASACAGIAGRRRRTVTMRPAALCHAERGSLPIAPRCGRPAADDQVSTARDRWAPRQPTPWHQRRG